MGNTSDVIFAGLNPHQKEAVEVLSGPLLILAGAGSGKTKTLTHRIANLIAHGTPPRQILAVTFTNKAANEMKTRIEKILEKIPGHDFFDVPTIGTFHATCVRILREDIEKLEMGINRNFVIFDTDDALSLIKAILKDFDLDEKETKPKPILSAISGAKNQLLTPENYLQNNDRTRFTDTVARIFPEYAKRLREHNALDFDDLLQKTVELFEKVPEVLKKYRTRWTHLLIDEYQDTNFAQYRLTRLLSDEHKNLCVIGDDHQSIYSFRGADYSNILNFEKDFPKAKIIKLEQNYRSTGHILKNANSLISCNRTGMKKNLWTQNSPGEEIKIFEVWNDKSEGQLIARAILEAIEKEGAKFCDFAVLYRMNAQSRSLEEALMRHQIPYQIVGGTRFFDRREIKDLIAYLRLIFNEKDDLAFLRIINVPARKIGDQTLEAVKKLAEKNGCSLLESMKKLEEDGSLGESKKTALLNFRDLINELREIAKTEPISILLDRVIEKTKFLESLDDGTSEGESRQQNVKELFSVATRYDSAESPLADFLEGVALVSDLDNLKESTDSITLMTVHASKGLEFPHVFLPGWEDGIFPSSNAQFSEKDLEEERRLGYVAITRAMRSCTISHARQRMIFGHVNYASPSKFLNELDEESVVRKSEVEGFEGEGAEIKTHSRSTTNWGGSSRPKVNFNPRPQASRPSDKYETAAIFVTPKTRHEALFGVEENNTGFKISDHVAHPDFGEGTIIQISGDILSIAFPGLGIKKLVASIAPLKKIDTP